MFRVKLKNLEIGYKKPLLSALNLELQEGKIIALIGRNGIGKSTLIKTIASILPPLSGDIFIEEENIKNYSAKKLAKIIGYSAAADFPVSNFTIRDFVSLGRLPYTSFTGLLNQKDKEIVSKAIRISRLEEIAHKDIRKISDGQRQRTSIARLIAQQSKLMLFDEPTAFLDIEGKYFTLSLFKEIKNKLNNIIVFSTHDLNLAVQFADQIWMFNNNTIIDGLPEDLILQGYFSNLFNDKNIIFNTFTGDFNVINKAEKKINISGIFNKTKFHWTENALKKIGFKFDENAKEKIQINDKNWVYSANNIDKNFLNLENLLIYLSNNSKKNQTQ